MQFVVVGAGLAGLFAAAVLQQDCHGVYEAQPELPNNHSAILRFKTGLFGETVNIPFKPVKVIKSYIPVIGNPIGDNISYSLKTNGSATLRSINTANGETVQRFIAPEDLVKRLAERVGVHKLNFGMAMNNVEFFRAFHKFDPYQPIISTLPMPVLARMLDYEFGGPEFKSQSGVNITATIENCDVYATLYLPDPKEPCYRVSITGNELIAEYRADTYKEHVGRTWNTPYAEAKRLLKLFGIEQNSFEHLAMKEQKYAKILPIDNRARKRFMLWATENHNVYSFGRYATWRPELQLDDLVKDLHVIQRMARGEGYERKLTNA
jgi:hypothetical protein